MLGEKVGELQAKVTTKVLPAEGSTPKFETSVEGSGTFLGVPINSLATYWSEVRADGSLYGECPNQGVIMTQDGEIATFTAAGAGGFTAEGGATFRGAFISGPQDRSWRVLMASPWSTSGRWMPTGMGSGTFGSGSSNWAGLARGQ